MARTCGFAEMKLAIFHAPPFHVSLGEFEDFLADGSAGERWTNSTRAFLRHVRTFFLFKEGTERVDSRSGDALACRIDATLVGGTGGTILEDQPLVVDVAVRNDGSAVWLQSEEAYGGVGLGVHLYDGAGKLLDLNFQRQRLTDTVSREIMPGERVACRVAMPPLPQGLYVLEIECVASNVAWFAQVGSQPARVSVEVVSI